LKVIGGSCRGGVSGSAQRQATVPTSTICISAHYDAYHEFEEGDAFAYLYVQGTTNTNVSNNVSTIATSVRRAMANLGRLSTLL
jgi:hypothetical protein